MDQFRAGSHCAKPWPALELGLARYFVSENSIRSSRETWMNSFLSSGVPPGFRYTK